jgi:hypothetical protein
MLYLLSNKGLDATAENKGTGVYVYAKSKRNYSTISLDEISKQYDDKTQN